MFIYYRDSHGVVEHRITNNPELVFDNGFAMFTDDNGEDYKITTESLCSAYDDEN